MKPKSRYYITGRNPRRGRSILMMTGLALAVCLTCAVLWFSGWPQRQAERLGNGILHATAEAGFSVEEISVEGRQHTDSAAVLAALQVQRGTPILSVEPKAAAERLRQLPWLESATVERRLPRTVFVKLYERQPVARWQYQNQLRVIDLEGRPLPEAKAETFAQLPLVVGEGAAEATVDLLADLADYPRIQKQLKAAIRVGNRRWDLALQSGITVRLPEENPENGLKRLAALMDEKIQDRDLIGIDLRQSDRLVLERPAGTSAAKSAAAPPKI